MTDYYHTPKVADDPVNQSASINAPFSEIDTAIRALGQKIIVADKDLTAPPGSPTDGLMYIPKATATGLWAGLENTLVYTPDSGVSWISVSPVKGLIVYVNDETYSYEWDGSAWVLANRYAIIGSPDGVPDDGAILIRHKPLIPIKFPVNLTGTGSNFYGKIAATAETVFSMKKEGSEFGTLTISAAGTIATIIVTSEISIAITEEFTLVNQATKDATFADIGFAIVAIKA